MRTYKHVISLGSFCGMAFALKRYNLRDASYPFDWVTCRLTDALRLYNTDFAGFLEASDALHWVDHPERPVFDDCSGLGFWHDFEVTRPIQEQLPEVRTKYALRIRRLLDAKGPILFVRHLKDGDEFDYLDTHMSEVLEILRKRDARNDLLLIANRTFVPQVANHNTDTVFKCGGLDVIRVDVPADDAYNFVNYNQPELINALGSIKYTTLTRIKNHAWKLKSKAQAILARFRKRAGHYGQTIVHRTKDILRPLVVVILGERRVQSLLRSIRKPR